MIYLAGIPQEEVREVPGYEGVYYVSVTGHLFSRYAPGRGMRQLRGARRKGGYIKVILVKPGAPRWHVDIHRLVALAFLGPPPPGQQCAHLDGNPANNRLENIAYVTPKENAHHKWRHGTMLRGSQHPQSRLIEADVRAILGDARQGKELAMIYGVSVSTISAIRTRRKWAHVR